VRKFGTDSYGISGAVANETSKREAKFSRRQCNPAT
jgi:hypothetical protein